VSHERQGRVDAMGIERLLELAAQTMSDHDIALFDACGPERTT